MIGVVADDITGANDIGIMFAKAGYVVHVYSFREEEPLSPADRPHVLILDTDSRFDSAEAASRKVHLAAKALSDLGCTTFFNKTCSVFRGNIGTEFDAMLDEMQADFAVVVLGFPKNGRQTLEGIHYVHGVKLEDSEFRRDPVHPMTESNIVDILQKQTSRKVGLISIAEVEKGSAHIKEMIEHKKRECQYVIMDVADQRSLRMIAEAVRDEPILCGSSAIAEELAQLWGPPLSAEPVLNLPAKPATGILCAAGSLTPQTAAQIAYLKEKGIPAFELDTPRLFAEDQRSAVIAEMAESITRQLRQGRHALLYSANGPEIVAETVDKGRQLGISETQTARIVSGATAEITARCMKLSGQNRLVTAGGDTSAAVCRRLGIGGLRVWKEIEPGLPSCVSLTEPAILLVLKSGSFGTPEFLYRALKHLENS